jgi:hypothetical protein
MQNTCSAYAAFVRFFEEESKTLNATELVEKYVFASEANENGTAMLVRLLSGA